MRFLRAQGATEYLVLLAVVLIIALVAIALLGFFPGMAADAQLEESEIYWRGAAPISIVEASAINADNPFRSGNFSVPYLRIRNTGNYPIAITKVWAGNTSVSQVFTGGWDPTAQLSTIYSLYPGEEGYFGYPAYFGSPQSRFFALTPASYSYVSVFTRAPAVKSYCGTATPFGYLAVDDFGFEYVVTIEGQSVTKRQTGKLVVRCTQSRAS